MAAAAVRRRSLGGGTPLAAATRAPPPSLAEAAAQKAVLLFYLLIPIWSLALTAAMLAHPTTRWPAAAWLLWINAGPGARARTTGAWPTPLRRLALWGHFAAYFPAQMVRTAALDPSRRCIFALAPHGILTFAAWAAFDTDACGFSSLFPGIDVHALTLSVNFRLPLLRELLLALGVCDASRASCLRILKRGAPRGRRCRRFRRRRCRSASTAAAASPLPPIRRRAAAELPAEAITDRRGMRLRPPPSPLSAQAPAPPSS